MWTELAQFEGEILLFIQNHIRNEFFTPIITFITSLGDGGFIWIFAAVVLLCFKKTRKAGMLVSFSLLGTLLVNNLILKNLIARTRPYEVIEGLSVLIPEPGEYSFPSGHTGSSFAAAVTIFLSCPKKIGIPALFLAFLIGLSRLYVGVHYPTDVLGGMITGTLIAVSICRLYQKKLSEDSRSLRD